MIGNLDRRPYGLEKEHQQLRKCLRQRLRASIVKEGSELSELLPSDEVNETLAYLMVACPQWAVDHKRGE